MKRRDLLQIGLLGLFLSACGQSDAPSALAPHSAEPNMSTATDETALYTCPMHPHYISTDPDGTCPICGMDVVPAHPHGHSAPSDRARETAASKTVAPVSTASLEMPPASLETGIQIAPQMIQTMGVRTALVDTVTFGDALRAFGTVETDQRLENTVASRLEGWIETLKVRAEGDQVHPGALLYRVYSPDLISAQKDFLNALRIGNESRIAAVRQRLLSLGMQDTVIAQLTKTDAVIEHLPVYAEAGGTVDDLLVREGDYIKPGTPILRLQSYADVWVIAAIPESDLPQIDTGQPVRLAFPSAPNAPSSGTIAYVYPTIDPSTRTAQLRIEVPNTGGVLRPGAYADIELERLSEPRLSVPTEAVLRDSRGAHVIVALGEGAFASRPVRTGIHADDRTEILHGLAEGERVVASGQFLLDSEASLREGLSKLEGTEPVLDPHAGHH